MKVLHSHYLKTCIGSLVTRMCLIWFACFCPAKYIEFSWECNENKYWILLYLSVICHEWLIACGIPKGAGVGILN